MSGRRKGRNAQNGGTVGSDAVAARGAAGPGVMNDKIHQVLDDPTRLDALFRFIVREGDSLRDFQTLTEMAAESFAAPIAAIGLIEREHKWFHTHIGIDVDEVPSDSAFGRFTIAGGGAFVVEDAAQDPRFAENPLVVGEPHVRFYAGAPIVVHGQRVGTLSVMDVAARPPPSDAAVAALMRLAGLAGSIFELNDAARRGRFSERTLGHAEIRQAMAMRAAKIASWSWDLATDIVDCDETLRTMFGLPAGLSVSGRDLIAAITPEHVVTLREALRDSLVTDQDFSGEFRIAATGRWVLGLGRVFERDAEGRATAVLGVYIDITATKESEEKTRLLLRELNHRVKNTLAMLQSLAGQTLRRSRNDKEFTIAFSGRLQALAAAHTLLSDREWESIDLLTLLKTQVSPYAIDFDEQVSVSCPEMALDPDEALGLGLVLHELATNAAKFGALSRGLGRVRVACTEDDAEARVIEWTESGGPTVKPPKSGGFGSILIARSLDKIVGSSVTVAYPPEGLHVRIRIPKSRKGG